MRIISNIFIIILTISLALPSNAKDLYKKNLNIKKMILSPRLESMESDRKKTIKKI